MANRERGELLLESPKGQFRLVLNTNAMAVAETVVSTAARDVFWDEVWTKATQGSVRHLRAVLFGMMQKYHQDITVAAVGEVIDSVGGLSGLSVMLERATRSASPDPDDVKALEDVPSDPLRAQGGVGAASTVRHVVPA